MSQSLLRYCFSIAILGFFSISAMHDEKSIQIGRENLFVPKNLGNMDLYHDDEGFSIAHDYGITRIKPYNVDKELRGASQKDLAKLITARSYISVKEINDGEDYSLKLNHRMNGGGAGGATVGFYVGKGLTYFIFGAPLVVVSLVCPVAGALAAPVYGGFMASALVGLESASNVGGLIGAIALGSATGPV